MFKERELSGLMLVRDIRPGQDASFSPQIGDIAALKVDGNDMEIHVRIESEEIGRWKGKITSCHPVIRGKTPAERIQEIRRDQEFIDTHDFSSGREVSFSYNQIFCLYRG